MHPVLKRHRTTTIADRWGARSQVTLIVTLMFAFQAVAQPSGVPASPPPDEAASDAEAEELSAPGGRVATEQAGVDEIRDADSVALLLAARMAERDAVFEGGPADFIAPAWRDFALSLEESIDLRLGFAHTILYHSTVGADKHDQGASGDLDLFGTWDLLGDEAHGNAGRLVFSTEFRYQIGGGTPFELGEEFGALGPTADGFGERPVSLRELFWEQELADERLVFALGKLDPGAFYNTNRLSNVNRSFAHTAFATNLARAFPGEGIGANVTVRPNDGWYVLGGVHDANGSASTGDFRDLDEAEFAWIAELGLTPQFDRLGRGNYRLSFWYTDEREGDAIEDDIGFAVSVDQEVGERLVVFGRYGRSEGDATAADNALAVGFGIEGIADREDDFLALAVGWLSPPTDGADEELVTEVVYRAQLTRVQELSLSFQTIFNPSFSDDDEVVGVVGVRWRIAL